MEENIRDLLDWKKEEISIRVDPTRLKTLSVDGRCFRSANDYELSEGDRKQARLDLNETDFLRKPCLEELKELLSRDNRIRYRTDDAYLLRYLRYRKFSCEKAYECIRNFYSIRRNNPQLFSLLPNLEYQLNTGLFTYLPYRDEEGSIIFVNRYGKWNTDEMKLCDIMQLFHVIADIINMNPSCQINGIIGIWDIGDVGSSHIAEALHPSSLRVWLKLIQELYPWRVKRLIILHCNKVVSATFNAIRYTLLKKKIADRVTILQSDMSKLHEIVNPVLLPKEYGGSLEESECSITQHILDNVPYLKYERSFAKT